MAKVVKKGDLVLFALRKFAIASNASLTDVEPQSLVDALDDLETMVGEWEIQGLNVNYNFATGDTPPNPQDDSGIPTGFKSGVGWQLALRLASDYGIHPTPRQEANAERAYDAILTSTLKVPPIHRRGDMPTGQGNKQEYYRTGRFFSDLGEKGNWHA